jgi:putative oxidoreductase
MQDVGVFVLRLVTGAIFVAHGYPKLFGGPGKPVPSLAAEKLGPGFVAAWQEHGGERWANRLETLGVPAPKSMAVLTGLVELVGGVCLVLGLFTRPAAFLMTGQMIAAIWKVHWKNGLLASRGGYEFNLSLIAALLLLLLGGPGRISVDGK